MEIVEKDKSVVPVEIEVEDVLTTEPGLLQRLFFEAVPVEVPQLQSRVGRQIRRPTRYDQYELF